VAVAPHEPAVQLPPHELVSWVAKSRQLQSRRASAPHEPAVQLPPHELVSWVAKSRQLQSRRASAPPTSPPCSCPPTSLSRGWRSLVSYSLVAHPPPHELVSWVAKSRQLQSRRASAPPRACLVGGKVSSATVSSRIRPPTSLSRGWQSLVSYSSRIRPPTSLSRGWQSLVSYSEPKNPLPHLVRLCSPVPFIHGRRRMRLHEYRKQTDPDRSEDTNGRHKRPDVRGRSWRVCAPVQTD